MEQAMKNVYFLSDAHLGSRAIPHGRTQERRLVNFWIALKTAHRLFTCLVICSISGMNSGWSSPKVIHDSWENCLN